MYLLDSNIFIEAQNRYYASDICPGFWAWLDDANARGLIASIGGVHDELTGRDDELARWIGARRDTGWFLDVADGPTQAAFAEVVLHVEGVPRYTRPNKDLFLSGADPWLIAKARTMGCSIATHETYSDESRRVKIPNVCRNFGINSHNTFDVLRHLEAAFQWSRAA